MVTSEWPTPERPLDVPFLAQQVKFVRRAGARVDIFHFRGARNPINYLKAWRRLRREHNLDQYDVLHAQFGQSALLLWPRRRPVVVTFHGCEILGMKDDDGRPTLAGGILQLLLRAVSHRADAVIIVSDQMRDHIPRSVPVHLLPTGVDLESIPDLPKPEARRRVGLPPDERLVLFPANPMDGRKRYALARRAVDLLNERLPTQLIVGWNRTHEQILLLMNACDVLLVTSFQEGSPTVVKEALASNLPVVSVDVGDVAQRLSGVPRCEVCADDSPETIAEALERVVTSPSGARTRHLVQDLDERVLAARLVSIYESAMASFGIRGRVPVGKSGPATPRP